MLSRNPRVEVQPRASRSRGTPALVDALGSEAAAKAPGRSLTCVGLAPCFKIGAGPHELKGTAQPTEFTCARRAAGPAG